jgi:hypothetical protein
MKIQATDKTGRVHNGSGVKHFLVSEENGSPIVIVKETIIGDLNNYKVLTPGDEEFTVLARNLGYDVRLTTLR